MAKNANKPERSGRNPGTRKKDTQKPSKVETASAPASQISKNLQQSCLNIFRDALEPSSEDTQVVQEVKGHLFNRDFRAAFGREDYLKVYAARWSPSRALAYLQILDNVKGHILSGYASSSKRDETAPFRVVCLGGGAGSELVALAGWLRMLSTNDAESERTSLYVDLIDSADWSKVTEELHSAINSPPRLSTYASQTKKDANRAMLQPNELSYNFHRLDLLDAERMAQCEEVTKADLVTCMFTLNELYGESMSKTQQLLSDLTKSLRPGSCLLVVDSPGSYSTITINDSDKKYPMQWLLDYTLRGPPGKSENASLSWERLESVDSQWFRRVPGLQYPIELEDMRYQLHLYRKMADIGEDNNHYGA